MAYNEMLDALTYALKAKEDYEKQQKRIEKLEAEIDRLCELFDRIPVWIKRAYGVDE
jgi:tetrahydromethanopterin S-methyltransferase subunit G